MLHSESDLSEALEAVLERYRSTVRRLARQRGLQEHEVDEVFQEVRIRLWKALGDPERISTVKASYVHRATLSAALDLIRRRREREHPLEALEGGGGGPRPERREARSPRRPRWSSGGGASGRPWPSPSRPFPSGDACRSACT